MQEPQGTDANSRSTTGVERLLQFQPLRRDIEAGHKLCNVIGRNGAPGKLVSHVRPCPSGCKSVQKLFDFRYLLFHGKLAPFMDVRPNPAPNL